MEENVALNPKKQKKFNRSIIGIKKLLKKKAEEPKPKAVEEEIKEEKKSKVLKSKDGKILKRRGKARGLVYLSHIPHGFYEHQMTEYFKQFGVVTNARVIKSPRTGNSKGCAFVEFRDTAVAEIVAETMNNYLMGKRLIKAKYIPPKEQKRHAMRKFWTSNNNPANDLRLLMKKKQNKIKDEAEELKRARKLLSNLNRTKKRLSELGINYDFTPVDIPEALIKKEKEEPKVKIETDAKSTKAKKSDVKVKSEKTVKSQQIKAVEANVKKGKVVNEIKKQEPKIVQTQKEKAKGLKKAGIRPPGDFITIKQDDDSDSSYEFDSDEYEKMLKNDASDDGDNTGEESEEGESDDNDSEQTESEEEISEDKVLPKNKKGKGLKGMPPPPSSHKTLKKPLSTPAVKVTENKKIKKPKQKGKLPAPSEDKKPIPVSAMKRKVQQKPETPTKKLKFEKNKQKPLKKQFKKKKIVS